ncbi:MAG TPA: hypothetical protein DD381_05020 [Lentisphaeria bacterium]|nr:MAG: hypothetical protein A2X47_07650 [Lentisphaerae bacterium GWF2_38_69]HBM15692.1 hypothetical protein [Lentisphaeria bacterium]
MNRVVGIDWLNSDCSSILIEGDGKNNKFLTLEKSKFSGIVLLPSKSHQKPTIVDFNNANLWNSGFDNINAFARVPAWALFEAFKQKSLNPSWNYTSFGGKSANASCKDIASVLLKRALSSVDKYDMAVVSVPEATSSMGQENLIRSFPNGRDKIRLLWRSVAALIGLSDKHYTFMQTGKKVAVFDFQQHRLDITVLELKNDTDWIVPKRFLPKKLNFQTIELPPLDFLYAETLLATLQPNYDQYSLWQLAMVNGSYKHSGEKTDFVIPLKDNRWYEISTPLPKDKFIYETRYNLGNKKLWHHFSKIMLALSGFPPPSEYNPSITALDYLINKACKVLQKFDYALLCGPYLSFLDHSKLKSALSCRHIWREGIDTDPNLITNGCGIFGLKVINGLPTYFDQLPRLDLVVQDLKDEDIKLKPLIDCGEVRGNEEYTLKEPITGCQISQYDTAGHFYLRMEDEEKLRELKQLFNVRLSKNAEIELYPRMRPGQGMAIVEVHNNKIFPTPVLLDWEKMTESEETEDSLRKKIDRSFPPYIPAVKANNSKWSIAEPYIKAYTLNERSNAQNVAKKLGVMGKDPDDKSDLGRINVFGNNPDYKFPAASDISLINKFLEKLKLKYTYKNQNDYKYVIGAIAWTYQSDYFEIVRKDLIDKLKSSAPLKIQELTACANLFCDSEDYKAYFNKVLDMFRLRGNERMSNYVIALKKMLSYRNDALLYIESEKCYKMMEHLNSLFWNSFIYGKFNILKNALSTILFMLKRRCYDRNFLPYNSVRIDRLLGIIISNLEKIIVTQTRNGRSTNLMEEILRYLKSSGRLEGMIEALKEEDDEDDDEKDE